MADPNPEAVFAELARKEGYSDDEIVAALKQRKASTQPGMAPAGSSLPQAHSDKNPLRDDAPEGDNAMLEGAAHPQSVGDILSLLIPSVPAGALSKAAVGLGRGVQRAGDALKPLAKYGLLESAMTGNVKGAALATVPHGASWIGRAMQKVGEVINPASEAAPLMSESAPVAKATEGAVADVLSAEDVARLRKQGYNDELIERIREGMSTSNTTRAAAPALAMKVGTPMSAAERAVEAEKRVMANGDSLEAKGREAFRQGQERGRAAYQAQQANAMADSRGLPEPRPAMEMPPSSIPDASFVRGVPAQPMMPERTGLPPHRAGIPMNPSPNDASFVRSIPAEVEEIVPDPKTGRGKRAYSSGGGAPLPVKEGVLVDPETPRPVASHAPSFASEVKRLSDEGYGAEDIGDRLKGHPELKDASSRAARTNLVREARGGDSGQIPARVRKAVDDALEGLKTDADRRAYLLRAPNAAIYTYVKSKLGL